MTLRQIAPNINRTGNQANMYKNCIIVPVFTGSPLDNSVGKVKDE
jgi:hypothetical protein